MVVNLSGNILSAQGKTGKSNQNSGILVKSSRLSQCIIKTPENFDEKKIYSLVVALHGNGGNGTSFARIWEGFNNPQFILAVPEGSYIHSNAFQSGRKMYSWYLQTRNREIWKTADPLSEDFVINVLDEVFKNYKIGRVFILGFSPLT